MKYILRKDNGLISKHQRCKDEPRYTYYVGKGVGCDVVTDNKNEAKIFSSTDDVQVHSKNWKFIKI